ncbi:MAG TPA: hypothetical protein PKZ20_10125 [Rhodocyclaceae bacterium]|nr:hypothetical protein [Rhodocyclaceae bacterium]
MISILNPTGEFPRTLPHLLPDNAAQQAVDCDLTTNILTGIHARGTTTAFTSAANAKSIFVYDTLGGSWFSWPTDVDAVRGPVVSDAYKRVYWTDGTYLKVTRGDLGTGGVPSQSYKAGVPRPTQPLTAASGVVDGKARFTATNTYIITAICEDASRQVKSSRVVGTTIGTDTASQLDITVDLAGFACKAETTTTTNQETATGQSSSSTGYYSYNPYTSQATTSNSGETTATGTTTTVVEPATTMAFDVRCSEGGVVYSSVVRSSAPDSSIDPLWQGVSAYFTSTGTQATLSFRRSTDYIETRAYTYTLVNNYGEEGPPAPALEVECGFNATLTVNIPPVAPNDYAPIQSIRIYRTSSGAAVTDYLYAGEVPLGTTSFSDENAPGELGEVLATRGYNPPEYGLQGLCVLPNGVMCAFKDNEVHFSEPYLAYAWKEAPMTTDGRVVGVCPAEGGVYVTTTKNPYFISGVTPDAMTQNKITAVQAGVAKGAICNIGPAVIYASHDGLVSARGVDVSMDWSFKFFTRDEWRSRFGQRLSLMRLNAHDGHLIAWFTDGTPGFIMRYDETDPSFVRMSEPIYAATVHPLADALYLVAGNVYEFKGAASRRPFVWHSKDFVVGKPTNFGALQLIGQGAVTVRLFADGVERVVKSLTLGSPDSPVVVRLPAGFLARRWSIRFEGAADAELQGAHLAVAVTEFAGV